MRAGTSLPPPGLVSNHEEMLRTKTAEYIAAMLVPPLLAAPPPPVLAAQPPTLLPRWTAQSSQGFGVHGRVSLGVDLVAERQTSSRPVSKHQSIASARSVEPTLEDLSGAVSTTASDGTERGQQRVADDHHPSLLSLGSIGHPHSCTGACRYVKRKGGCRDGLRCTQCHLCFWRRDECGTTVRKEEEPPKEVAVAEVRDGHNLVPAGGCDQIEIQISRGTQGHPRTCATACRYVRRKTGCRNGPACPNCHACLWTRSVVHELDPVGLGEEEESQNIFENSGKTLQGLIHLFIQSQDEADRASSTSKPTMVGRSTPSRRLGSVSAPRGAELDSLIGKSQVF